MFTPNSSGAARSCIQALQDLGIQASTLCSFSGVWIGTAKVNGMGHRDLLPCVSKGHRSLHTCGSSARSSVGTHVVLECVMCMCVGLGDVSSVCVACAVSVGCVVCVCMCVCVCVCELCVGCV